ncbi:MAG TPA: EVE domain-containing protein [Myxococcota bacterium]|jgi:predicted RNA-binding protein with PUA-like domain
MVAARGFWLVKSEPSTYSWQQFVAEKGTFWSGVRNPMARNNLAAMRKGDAVLFYHSGEGKAVIGLATVTRESYPDPSADDPKWLVVDLAPSKPLAEPVTLAAIKAEKSLAEIALVRFSRLSVQPLPRAAFEKILAMGKTKP